MKDATGELSMTAVAVVAIAGIAALFGAFVWPQIRANITRNTWCSQATDCQPSQTTGYNDCTYLDVDGNPQPVQCPDDTDDIDGIQAGGTQNGV